MDRRSYKFKNAAMNFICPLCSTERSITTTPRLSVLNYVQIIFLTGLTTFGLFNFVEFAGLLSFFFYWAGFEMGKRIVFRKDIPCPHCGFDASWYQRDVKVAKKLVTEFWQNQKLADSNNQPAPSQASEAI